MELMLRELLPGFFDYIENIIEKRIPCTMTEFALSVDNFFSFYEFKILNGKGAVSHG